MTKNDNASKSPSFGGIKGGFSTKAVRLYGKSDLRLEEFQLPAIKDDEIFAKVVSDSICMSSYKAATQGADHKRVPNDVAENPIIIGHEFSGDVAAIGEGVKNLKIGGRVTVEPCIVCGVCDACRHGEYEPDTALA